MYKTQTSIENDNMFHSDIANILQVFLSCVEPLEKDKGATLWPPGRRLPIPVLDCLFLFLHAALQIVEFLSHEKRRCLSHFPSFTQMCKPRHRPCYRRHLFKPMGRSGGGGGGDLSVQLQAARKAAATTGETAISTRRDSRFHPRACNDGNNGRA